MSNVLSVLFQRQYHLTGGLNRNSSSVFKQNFLPPSAFELLNVDMNYEFIDFDSLVQSPITAIACQNSDVLLANDVGHVVLLNKNFKEKNKISCHHCAIFDVKWRPDYQHQIATAAGDRSIIFWDLNTSKSINQFYTAHWGSVKTLAFQSPNTFVSGGRDGAIKVWDIRNTCAYKDGPAIIISDPHIHKLPSIKSVNFKSPKLRRLNSIACLSENVNYHPSNVVTCVQIHPNNVNYFFSSGIADDSIKMWDIRSCRRQFQCSISPTPVKILTTKNVSKASSNQGYSSFAIKTDSSYKPILFASSTNGSIYAFTSNSLNPEMVFSGRYSNSQTKISFFGDDYLLSGSTNGCVYIWACNFNETLKEESENKISIENRLPIYELNFNDQHDLPLVFGHIQTQSIYCSSEPNLLWRWKFKYPSREMAIDVKCKAFIAPDNHVKTININSKRTSFEDLTYKSRSSMPLTTITNWFRSETKRFKSNPENNSVEMTPNMNNDENKNNVQHPKSTSHKTSNGRNRSNKNNRHSKRNLFSDNRKIHEFFTSF